MRALLLSMMIVVSLAPIAAAVHQCDYVTIDVAGVETWACVDERGLPHWVMVKDETLGGVQANHPFFASGHSGWWGEGDAQSTQVVIWTYEMTPVGRSWLHPFYWCVDHDGDGFCDDTWIGASTYARGFFNQAHVSRDPYSGQWSYCLLIATGWQRGPLPDLGPGAPYFPPLP